MSRSASSRSNRAASSSPSPPSDGGEGRGEEVRFYWFPLSSVLPPRSSRGEDGELDAAPGPPGGQRLSACDARRRFCRLRFVELIVVLLIVGAVLLILETILPGLVAGILGFVCLLAGIIAGYAKFGAGGGNWVLTGVVLGLGGGFAVWVKGFSGTPMARGFGSNPEVGNIVPGRAALPYQ